MFCVSAKEYQRSIEGYPAVGPLSIPIRDSSVTTLKRFIAARSAESPMQQLRQSIEEDVPSLLNRLYMASSQLSVTDVWDIPVGVDRIREVRRDDQYYCNANSYKVCLATVESRTNQLFREHISGKLLGTISMPNGANFAIVAD